MTERWGGRRTAALLLSALAACTTNRPSPQSSHDQPSTQAGDTSRPAYPATDNWPGNPRLVLCPQDTASVYQADLVGILFDDSTSGIRVRSIFQGYGAEIFGGSQPPAGTGEYYVQMPGLDGSWRALDSVVAALRNEPGVLRAAGLSYRLPVDMR